MRHTFRYDVFLSFRGLDTRNNFTSHLYDALKRIKLEVFHDTSLPRGQPIATQLSKAIEESKIFVVVLSASYADSKWCLDELSQMMDCVHKKDLNDRQILLPVFLYVDKSDVVTQEGSFNQLITNLEAKFDPEMVQKWRVALQKAGELPGLHLENNANRYENELLEQVVEKIRKLLHSQPLADPHHVGIESQVQQVMSLLNPGSNDVRVVVIHGPAGIGKTTIAKATYDRLAIQFKARCRCFLSDVKATFGEANGKLTLQKNLISNISRNDESQIRIDNYHQGIGKIEKMIKNQKLLLVLDDVDNEEQLKILGMNSAILGGGSRIIVTTREEPNVVRVKPNHATYEPRLLDEKESLEVFCLNVFGQDHAKEGYEDVSKKAACWGAGCPGVLKNLAVYMRRYQSVEQWGWALRYVKQNPSCLTERNL